MKLFEGKSPTERNKIIAAGVLGVLSLFSLWLAFGGSIFSGTPTVTVTASPTPKTSPSPNATGDDAQMPSADEQELAYVNSEVRYVPGSFNAPDAGRNIFAFYEPPPPTPYVTPIPIVKIETPVTPPPTPTPAFIASQVTPQSVYAGSKGFRLEVYGDRFTPDSRIYFNNTELATVFVSPQKLTADISANLIAGEGARQIIVQTPDGKSYSNQIMLNVQAAPRPDAAFQYIGMISRKGYNNDTAYFQEKGKKEPSVARLNDTVGGRFRLFSISSSEVVVEDKELGFRYKVPLYRPEPGQNASTTGRGDNRNRFPNTYTPYNPNNPNNPQEIPGIPSNIPRYVPPPQPKRTEKKDDDDDDDGDGPK
jgi:hypothetical protein